MLETVVLSGINNVGQTVYFAENHITYAELFHYRKELWDILDENNVTYTFTGTFDLIYAYTIHYNNHDIEMPVFMDVDATPILVEAPDKIGVVLQLLLITYMVEWFLDDGDDVDFTKVALVLPALSNANAVSYLRVSAMLNASTSKEDVCKYMNISPSTASELLLL